MLTIEKRPNTLQKASVLAAAFMIGLVGSAGALYTIDPKQNAAVVQTTETDTTKVVKKQPATQAKSSMGNTDEPVRTETPVWMPPTNQAPTSSSQPAPSTTEKKSEPTPQAEPEKPADETDTSDEETSSDSGILIPILQPLLP